MKRCKLFRVIALVAAVVISMTACSQDSVRQERKKSSEVQNVQFERIWKYDEAQEHDVEYAIIMGMNPAGEVLWTHVSEKYPCAQDDVVAEVLLTETQYIYCENGSLIALDISTGEKLWENSEFGGYGVCGIEGNNGNFYFCGYLGTPFFAVDTNGKTLHKIESFGLEYGWAHDIRFEGEKIAVTLDLGPEELRGPDGFVMFVDPMDYSFSLTDAAEGQGAHLTDCSLPVLAGDISQVVPMDSGAVAVLYTDATVGIAGNDMLAAQVASWKNIAQLYLGTEEGNLTARRTDGTAVSTEYDLSGWHDIKELFVCWQGIAGLTEDGRVFATGYWESGSPDGWTQIRDFGIYEGACFGLKYDGSIICTEKELYNNICSLENVQKLQISDGLYVTLEDGRITSPFWEEPSEELRGAVKFIINGGWPFALSADGCLLAKTDGDGWIYNDGDYFTTLPRENAEEYPNIYVQDIRFQNIKDILYQDALILLKYDGSVDTVNVSHYWDLSQWKDIEKIVTAYADGWGTSRIYGIKQDGSVIVAEADHQQPSVSMENYLGWRVLELFAGADIYEVQSGVVGITQDGTLVGDGDYANTDFSVLID